MSPALPPPTPDPNEEIARLIETLHATGQRLEELTAGEVDAVADRDGRTFLLRHVQERLRHMEAAKQAAILNALPANIALLDSQGRIVSVNEAWRRAAEANMRLIPRPIPADQARVDYLDFCDSAQGDGAYLSQRAAAGIRALLTGTAKRFSLEYHSHLPSQQRWFVMTVTPLSEDQPNGVVVMHLDVTAARLAEERQRESERQFSAMLANVELISLMLDRAGGITYCNDYLLCLTGWQYEEVIGQNWFDLFLPPDLHDFRNGFFSELLANKPETWHHENEILTRAGERRLIRWNNTVLRSATGEVNGIATIGEDITEQKRAELGIKRLNRVYAVLSGINGLIVRVRDRDELYHEACRIAVEAGFPLVWLGIVDALAMRIVPVAWHGDGDDYIGHLPLALSETQSLPVLALQQRKVMIGNDMRENPYPLLQQEALKRGFKSKIVLPLLVADQAVGVLTLYASEFNFFNDDEVKLLRELANDIAFAIDHLDQQERLDYLAWHDTLTGLANRSLFLDRVAQYMRGAVSGGHKLAVLLIDLERFKNLNDSLGRPAGDELLRQVAAWLTRDAGDTNLLARVGADHFAMVLPEVGQAGDVARRLETMTAAFLAHPFRLNDTVFRIAVKVGVAVFPEDGAEAEILLRHAEDALKNAKNQGEGYLFYTQKMTDAVAGKLTLENQLRQALDNGEFVLHYQPKVNLASGKLTSAEALIRWNDPRTGLVPPVHFISILEEIGLIHEVGRWALHTALADYLRWRRAGLPAVRIAVNVSPLQLRHRGFIAEIGQAIAIDTAAADGLELEITESLIMADIPHSIASLQAIRGMGVSIAIDDFGTGFSSLSYLAKLPVDTLKIDRSFVIEMTTAPEGLALVATIINMAHALKLKVVAEGVESEEQSRLLRLLDCDEMQGFLFSKPVPADVFESRFLAPPAPALETR